MHAARVLSARQMVLPPAAKPVEAVPGQATSGQPAGMSARVTGLARAPLTLMAPAPAFGLLQVAQMAVPPGARQSRIGRPVRAELPISAFRSGP
jgi:hypothetical protein